MLTVLVALWLGGIVAMVGIYAIEWEQFRRVGHRHLDQLRAYPEVVLPLMFLLLVFWPATIAFFYAKVRDERRSNVDEEC